jgi:hypothetical protein
LHTTLAWALAPTVAALAVVVAVATAASRHPAGWHSHNASPAHRAGRSRPESNRDTGAAALAGRHGDGGKATVELGSRAPAAAVRSGKLYDQY